MWKEKHDTLYDHSSDFHCDTLYLWKYHFPVGLGVSSENLGTKNRSCRRCSKIWKSNLCVSSDSLPPTWTLFLSHTLWHLDTHTNRTHTDVVTFNGTGQRLCVYLNLCRLMDMCFQVVFFLLQELELERRKVDGTSGVRLYVKKWKSHSIDNLYLCQGNSMTTGCPKISHKCNNNNMEKIVDPSSTTKDF